MTKVKNPALDKLEKCSYIMSGLCPYIMMMHKTDSHSHVLHTPYVYILRMCIA